MYYDLDSGISTLHEEDRYIYHNSRDDGSVKVLAMLDNYDTKPETIHWTRELVLEHERRIAWYERLATHEIPLFNYPIPDSFQIQLTDEEICQRLKQKRLDKDGNSNRGQKNA